MTYTDLLGKTFTKVHQQGEDELIFVGDLESYKFYHSQDCCEDVHIDDVIGDLFDLVNSPILQAEETISTENRERGDGITWTFYKFATIKGYVTIRWYGSSNGYYSEKVDFRKVGE